MHIRKSINRIIIITLVFISIFTNIVYSADENKLYNILTDAGVPKEYRQNIINYVDDANMPVEELEEAIFLTKATVNMIGGRLNIFQFDLDELYQMYINVNRISELLNIRIYINFINGSLSVMDMKTTNILFQGEIKNLGNYYIMYEKLMDNEDFLKKILSEN